jgi:glycosyltransferase involved in cell wall biosynthesis
MLEFDKRPGGKIWAAGKNPSESMRYCLDKMRIWGYFVAPSKSDVLPAQKANKSKQHEIKVLWVGRLLDLKRVDTIVRAIVEHANMTRVDPTLLKITRDIYGNGPEETRLREMVCGCEELIKFYPPVPITEVRNLMHNHDVYVLSSNGSEGWGAVVSEALEEGMKVIGTYEAGSSATILPEDCLFHAGDWRALLRLLQSDVPKVGIGEWTARKASELIVDYK